jgi:hypothetical protein
MNTEAAATETIQPEAQEVPETPVESTEAQAQPEAKVEAFDPAKVDPKVKEHFEKEYSEKYKDYEDAKKAANELRLMHNDPAFQKWIMSRNKPEPAKPFEITDEQFTAGLSDKAQFVKLIQEAAKHLVQNEIGPKLQQTDQHFQVEAKKQELADVITKYPDFKELDKRGLIAPIVEKYNRNGINISFEDAYWAAKKHTWNEDVAKAARGQVQDRKTASVEKPNNAPGARRNVVKFDSREEALQAVAEALAAGREAPEIDYD